MHLLPTSEIRLDDGEDAVDLALPPGDVLVLSFTDSDLSALAVAARACPEPSSWSGLSRPSTSSLVEGGVQDVDASHKGERDGRGLTVRLGPLRRLKHPLSVDFLIEKTASQCRFVLVRCLGGLDYWRYGIEQLGMACRERGIPLAILPGDERDDPRLGEHATVPPAFAAEMLAHFQAGGGAENMRRLLGRIGRYLADEGRCDEPGFAALPIPPILALGRNGTPLPWREALAASSQDRPLVPILLYRSGIVAGDVAMGEAIAAALAARDFAPLPLALTSLKDPAVTADLAALIAIRKPALIVTTTAFSARESADFVLDGANCPILQAVPVGSPREAWEVSPRGLSATDLAMQVALPEFDGRIGAIPVAFKAEETDPTTGLAVRRLVPDADGIAALADLAQGWITLARKSVAERKLALVMSDYPARGGRAGFAVGLDTPASVTAIQELLVGAGYSVGEVRPDGQALMATLTTGPAELHIPLAAYRDWLAAIPAAARDALLAAHGAPENDPACRDGAFHFRAMRYGLLTVALQPPRDATPDRKARYHDPDAPPGHGYLAFYLALRQSEAVDALVHLGTHGTMEWLPGKAVALSTGCWPRLAVGGLPVIYPYVVDDPGEAAPAKRRLAAVTLGHLPPPLAGTEAAGETALLRDLVEEFSQAQVLDPRRADIVAGEIRARAEESGLAASCGVAPEMEMSEALTRLDAHLCDIAELPFRDGLHVFGQSNVDVVSARNERENLLAALDSRFVVPGPAGAPHRGRPDVLPTGRNLSTLDPRAIPTRAAARLGRLAAQAVVSRHLQDHGDHPRRIVMDLWASPTLRSGGEDIAHALALMGVEPIWDSASTRVTGFSIIPQPKLAYPRLDVTVRISGTFRDTFPGQIALIDQAARAVAALDEPDDWNEPAAARRRGEHSARIFGAAPGRYGAAMADRALDGDWTERAELGAAYLAASDHAYGGPEGMATAHDGLADRIRTSDAFIHVSDTAGRDILEATSAADVIGGLAAAAEALGADPALYSLDSSNPEAPKARTLVEDIARIVHGRLTHPRWITAQLAHGWRGAAELAEAVDTLFVFAASTDAVADGLFDAVFQAYCADPQVWSTLEAANAPAAASIRARLTEAARRGLWTSRRNSVGAFLAREAAE